MSDNGALIELRCSMLPLAAACMASQFHPGPVCESTGPEARLGTAVHKGIEIHLMGNDGDEIAAEYDVDEKDYDFLLCQAKRSWDQIKGYFVGPGHPWPTVEHYLEAIDEPAGIRLTGHIDVSGRLSGDSSTGMVLDWKTGYRDPNALDQLKGYAYLLLSNFPELDRVWAWLVLLREGVADRFVFTRAEIERWWMELSTRIAGPLRYNPGRHCGYCPRQSTCEAFSGLLTRCYGLVRIDLEWQPMDLTADTPSYLAVLMDCCRILEDHCDKVRLLIKSRVSAAGGILSGGDRELVLKQVPQKKISYPAAAPLLTQELGSENLIPLLQISKTKLEEYIRSKAPRGQKAKVVSYLMDQLEQAGAIQTTYVERLEIRNVPSEHTAISLPAPAADEAGAAE